MATRTLPALSGGAVDVLKNVTIDGDLLTLPPGQLAPPLYREVDKALQRLGGKWNRGRRGHVFTTADAAALPAALDAVLAAGRMPADEAKDSSFWPTPTAVAKEMASLVRHHIARSVTVAGLGSVKFPNMRILEPSAGEGHLAVLLRRWFTHARFTAVEPDAGRYATLFAALSDGPGGDAFLHRSTLEDYLTAAAGRGSYDAIIMNPPFTLPGRPRAWAEHILMLWNSGILAPGGVLVSVTPSSIRHASDRTTTAVRNLAGAHGGIVDLPEDAFRDSGTRVNTALVWLTSPTD